MKIPIVMLPPLLMAVSLLPCGAEDVVVPAEVGAVMAGESADFSAAGL